MKLELSKNVVDERNWLQLRFDLLGGFMGCEKFGNCLVEYRDLIAFGGLFIKHRDWLMLVSKRKQQ